MSDFSKFETSSKSDEGVWVDIYTPDFTTKIAEIKVAGRDSKLIKRRQQELAKRKSEKRKYTAAEEDRDLKETVAMATLDWHMINPETGEKGKDGVVINEGKEIKVSQDNAFNFYEAYPWVLEQVIEVMGDRANFMKD